MPLHAHVVGESAIAAQIDYQADDGWSGAELRNAEPLHDALVHRDVLCRRAEGGIFEIIEGARRSAQVSTGVLQRRGAAHNYGHRLAA